MTDRDKIINIINSVKPCGQGNICADCKYNKELDQYKDTDMSCMILRIADALILNNIGDISEINLKLKNAESTLKEYNSYSELLNSKLDSAISLAANMLMNIKKNRGEN